MLPPNEKSWNIYGAWYLDQAHMQNFVGKIVSMMKEERLFAWQGGPIILAQVSWILLKTEDH